MLSKISQVERDKYKMISPSVVKIQKGNNI